MAKRTPFPTIEEARAYTKVVHPRLATLQNRVKHGVLPSLEALRAEYVDLMTAVAPGGELADYSDQVSIFLPADAQRAIEEIFADLDAVVRKLYTLDAAHPALLELDPPTPEQAARLSEPAAQAAPKKKSTRKKKA